MLQLMQLVLQPQPLEVPHQVEVVLAVVVEEVLEAEALLEKQKE
jgi:hypothetical protein